MLLKKSLLLVSVTSFWISLGAATAQAQPLLEVSRSDMPNRHYYIYADSDDAGDLELIRVVVTDPDEKFKPLKFTVSEMKSKAGAVIDRLKIPFYRERIATSLNARADFNGKEGGIVTFFYLYDFGDDDRRPIELKLVRTGNSWNVYKSNNNQLIHYIDFIMGGIGTGQGAKSYRVH